MRREGARFAWLEDLAPQAVRLDRRDSRPETCRAIRFSRALGLRISFCSYRVRALVRQQALLEVWSTRAFSR